MTDQPQTLDTVIAKLVKDWQTCNVSLPTPEMDRFARCVYYALLGSKVVTPPPTLDADELVRRVRLAVRSHPINYALTAAIQAHREIMGSTLEGAKIWVEAHPEAWTWKYSEDADELVRRVRLAVVSNPDCDAYVTALKSYRELTGMSLAAAKAWVNEHPDVTASSEDAELVISARVRIAVDKSMSEAEGLLYQDLVRQARTNPDAGSVVALASMPLELANERHGDIRAVRANFGDRARSLAVLYRIEGKRVVVLDVLTLPPIPTPPREPAP